MEWYDKTRQDKEERFHPTQKPIKLIEYILNDFTKEGDIVADFYSGSFNIPLVCDKSNRNWIGIEISPEYCKIAEKRIEKERAQLKLF